MLRKICYLLFVVSISTLLIACGQTTVETTMETTVETTIDNSTMIGSSTEVSYILPDLAGLSKSEMILTLNNLGIVYEISYISNQDLEDNTFVEYLGDFEIGSNVTLEDEIVVIISTTDLILPDLAGLTQEEIFLTLYDLGISFDTEIVNDNTVPDQTFKSYGDGLEVGSKIPASFTITVVIGYNSEKLPDLTNMIKEEIKDTLDDLNILFEFEYVIDDSFTEDLFESYKDVAAGDFYESGTVTINLYKNTFTESESSLIISKYIDGGNDTSDQAIELFNPTDQDIDLSDYHIVIYTNGSLEIDYSIDLPNTTLLQGETFVIANASANAVILASSDLQSQDLVFDGNDAVQLCYSNGTYIDTIYNIGSSSFIMDDEVFVRGEDVTNGTRIFIANQWFGFTPNHTEVLGVHPVTIPDEIEFTFIDREFFDPLGGMDFVTLYSVADGDTAYFTPGYMGDDRVRFLGCDTPETHPVVQDWGLEAKAYTTYVLEHAQGIYIQSDPDSGFVGGYGRALGLVWVNLGTPGIVYDHLNSDDEVVKSESLSGWVLLNYQIILNGYSYNYYGSDSSLAFSDRYLFRWFQEAERKAILNGVGVHE